MSPILPLILALAGASAPAAEAPIPEKIPSPPSEESVPTVNIRVEKNGDRVEEYRDSGRLTMVKVTPAHGKPYYLLDTNGDGKLSRAEAAHLPAIEARFDELDTNHDGFLSVDEFIIGAMSA